MSKLWQNVIVIAAGLLFALLYYGWFSTRMDAERDYKNSPAGKAEVEGDIEIRKMKIQLDMERQRTRQMEIENRGKPRQASQTTHVAAPAVPVQSVSPCLPQDRLVSQDAVKLSPGECITGEMSSVWVRFDVPPKEISGAAKLSLVIEQPGSGGKVIRLGETCQADFRECARNWAGESLYIQRAPGQQLVIRS